MVCGSCTVTWVMGPCICKEPNEVRNVFSGVDFCTDLKYEDFSKIWLNFYI